MSVNKCTVGVYLHFCHFFQVFLCLSENLQFFPNPSFSKSLKLSQKSFNDKNLFCTTHIFRTTRFCNRSCTDTCTDGLLKITLYCTVDSRITPLQGLNSSVQKLIGCIVTVQIVNCKNYNLQHILLPFVNTGSFVNTAFL